MNTTFIALYAWATFTHAIPGFSDEWRGTRNDHGLPCTPAVVVTSSNAFIRPWASNVTDTEYWITAENLGIPRTPVTLTVHAFCFGTDPLSPVEETIEEEDPISHLLGE